MGDDVESDNITDRFECDRNIDQLANMFEQYERGALADVLEANGGNVEETISMLLYQSEAQNNPSHQEHQSSDDGEGDQIKSQTTIIEENVLAAQKMKEESGILTSSQSPFQSPSPRNRETPSLSNEENRRGENVTLPDDFLRPHSWTYEQQTIQQQQNMQIDPDEQLAMLIQNEDFLAMHPEFSQNRNDNRTKTRTTSPQSETSIMENIKSMGESTKRSLQQLGRKWNIGNSNKTNATTSSEPTTTTTTTTTTQQSQDYLPSETQTSNE